MWCSSRTAFAIFCIYALHISAEAKPRIVLGDIIMNLLENFEQSGDWNGNMYLGLLFGQFLLKQATRFYESTRLEEFLHNLILRKIASLRHRIDKEAPQLTDTWLLQKNVVPVRPVRKEKFINPYLDNQVLTDNYQKLVDKGTPDMLLSDFCLKNISNLEDCIGVSTTCLKVVKSKTPSFGYYRLHQILLLYLIRHHVCQPYIDGELALEVLACQLCTQVYHEHLAIASLGMDKFKDLFLEQSTICGLFGYAEFNKRSEMEEFVKWEADSTCNCFERIYDYKYNRCYCSDHYHTIALVYFINALTMELY